MRQLLALARLDAQERVPASDWVAPAEVLQRTIAEYLEPALRLRESRPALRPQRLGALALNRGGLTVENDGPTIPADEVAKPGTRFFHGRNRHPMGSGLAIAKAALAKIGARLSIKNREDRTGVVCRVILGPDEASAAVQPA